MSSRTYYLRTRAGSGVATQTSQAVEEPPSYTLETDIPLNEIAPQVEGSVHSSKATVTARLYSDVAASRPPPPLRDRPLLPSGSPVMGTGHTNVPRCPDDDENVRDTDSSSSEQESNGEIETPDKIEGIPWTTVQHRRTRSLESFKNKKRTLTAEQTKAIKKATESMTADQRQQLQRRQEKVHPRRENSASSRGEGTSRPKGKTIDPREWGNVNISRESLDLEAQAAALNSFKNQADTARYSKRDSYRDKERSQSSDRGKNRRHKKYDKRSSKRDPKRSGRPAESQPAAQIAPKSYLGAAFKRIGRSKRKNHNSESPSDSDSSSFSSSSDSSSTSDSSSRSESSDDKSDGSKSSYHHGKKRRDNQHGRNKRRRYSGSSGSRSKIKPIPPKEYDGSVDVRAYHRFVREGDAYLRDGKVRGRRKVFLLSYYLTGKAYDFYTLKVAINEDQWTVSQFYKELFNYCFPVDYRMQLQKTLARCHQNDKSVAEYTHELQDLFNMIGNIPKQDQVLKFWNSARPSIQKELWRNKLNPELSSWKKVVAQAEIIEIAENVAERRDRRSGQTSQPSGVASGSGGGNQKTRHPPTGGSAHRGTTV